LIVEIEQLAGERDDGQRWPIVMKTLEKLISQFGDILLPTGQTKPHQVGTSKAFIIHCS